MSKTVKGFKAMRPDMTCRGFQFRVGETFVHEGEVIPCKSGFHFCQYIEDIQKYYNDNCRIFEVEASGEVVYDGEKTVTDTLTIGKEVDYSKYVNHHSTWVKWVVVNQGIGLDVLINDDDSSVRERVAKQGYGLDILVNDISDIVRTAVADQGYGLDILVNDYYWLVRLAVVKQGYGLDKLIHDPAYTIRKEIAKKGYGLDILINDDAPSVRETVARQGYGLDVLLKDRDTFVRYAAQEARKKNAKNVKTLGIENAE